MRCLASSATAIFTPASAYFMVGCLQITSVSQPRFVILDDSVRASSGRSSGTYHPSRDLLRVDRSRFRRTVRLFGGAEPVQLRTHGTIDASAQFPGGSMHWRKQETALRCLRSTHLSAHPATYR